VLLLVMPPTSATKSAGYCISQLPVSHGRDWFQAGLTSCALPILTTSFSCKQKMQAGGTDGMCLYQDVGGGDLDMEPDMSSKAAKLQRHQHLQYAWLCKRF
jgi:hypothetical protein